MILQFASGKVRGGRSDSPFVFLADETQNDNFYKTRTRHNNDVVFALLT